MYILQSKTNVCSIVVHFMARVSFFYPKFFEIIHAAFFDRKSFSVQMTSFRYALFLDKFFELYYYIMLCCLFDTYSIRLNTADCRQVMLTYPTTVSQLHLESSSHLPTHRYIFASVNSANVEKKHRSSS